MNHNRKIECPKCGQKIKGWIRARKIKRKRGREKEEKFETVGDDKIRIRDIEIGDKEIKFQK